MVECVRVDYFFVLKSTSLLERLVSRSSFYKTKESWLN